MHRPSPPHLRPARRGYADAQHVTARSSASHAYAGIPHSKDRGGYMVLDANLNTILAGETFDLDLDDLDGCLPA